MVEKRNARVLSLVHAPRGLKQTKFSKSVAAGGGVIGFRLVDRSKVLLCQINGDDREHDASARANNVGTTNSRVIPLQVMRILALTSPRPENHLPLSRGIGN
jgi:hypothetical protein